VANISPGLPWEFYSSTFCAANGSEAGLPQLVDSTSRESFIMSEIDRLYTYLPEILQHALTSETEASDHEEDNCEIEKPRVSTTDGDKEVNMSTEGALTPAIAINERVGVVLLLPSQVWMEQR